MYLEEQKILLCGIDHGFSTMKTAHFVFENGVKEIGYKWYNKNVQKI